MKSTFDPKKYYFNESINYQEIHDYFGQNTFIKSIAEHNNGKDHFYWYTAIKTPSTNLLNDERYTIYSGVFTKGKHLLYNNEFPKQIYFGLISTKEFGEILLMNLCGTLSKDSVLIHGQSRLNMKCCYLEEK